MDDDTLPLLVAAVVSLFVYVLAAASLALDEEECVSHIAEVAQGIGIAVVQNRWRKRHRRVDDDVVRVTRRRFICWDRERANQCIQQDYLGANPIFGLDDFKRIFRVSRSSYDALKSFLCLDDKFFIDGTDITGRRRVSVDAKILISLKYLAYGSSVNSFRDYFQIGESTALLAVKKVTSCIAKSVFQKKYFSFFTPMDAKRVEALHFKKHGIRGLLGSLDCSHFVWGNCPVAHHGQFQGKEGRPTIVVEALADYNLYAWHAVFGYCGTLNDINIWDTSYLLQSLCDGTFSGLDFPFTIGGEVFHSLFMLVDGIYPCLARFVKPISVPVGKRETLFSLWQESTRKTIERFFGVFKKKFHFFNRPIPFGFMADIIYIFYCCVILHNMAVVERLNSGSEEVESDLFYDCVCSVAADCGNSESRMDAVTRQLVEQQERNVRDRASEMQFLAGLGINVVDVSLEADQKRLEVLPLLERCAQERWNHLYDVTNHTRLTKAIIRELKLNYDTNKASKTVNF